MMLSHHTAASGPRPRPARQRPARKFGRPAAAGCLSESARSVGEPDPPKPSPPTMYGAAGRKFSSKGAAGQAPSPEPDRRLRVRRGSNVVRARALSSPGPDRRLRRRPPYALASVLLPCRCRRARERRARATARMRPIRLHTETRAPDRFSSEQDNEQDRQNCRTEVKGKGREGEGGRRSRLVVMLENRCGAEPGAIQMERWLGGRTIGVRAPTINIHDEFGTPLAAPAIKHRSMNEPVRTLSYV